MSLTPEENRHAVLLHVVRDKMHVRDMYRRLRLEVRYIIFIIIPLFVFMSCVIKRIFATGTDVSA